MIEQPSTNHTFEYEPEMPVREKKRRGSNTQGQGNQASAAAILAAKSPSKQPSTQMSLSSNPLSLKRPTLGGTHRGLEYRKQKEKEAR